MNWPSREVLTRVMTICTVVALAACSDRAANKETSTFEANFLDQLLLHHRGAVAMGRATVSRAGDARIREIATRMADRHEARIAQLSEWRSDWFPDTPQPAQTKFPTPESVRLHMDAVPAGSELDSMFVSMAVPYQQAAVELTRNALPRIRRRELKELSLRFLTEQESFITELERLRRASANGRGGHAGDAAPPAQ